MTERQIGLVTDKMILRHNDRKTYFFNDISSVVDGFCFPSTYNYVTINMLLSSYVPLFSVLICH